MRMQMDNKHCQMRMRGNILTDTDMTLTFKTDTDIDIQPRTKEFVHLSTEITSLFYKIITKTT